MKKLIAIVLAGIILLSSCLTAYAAVKSKSPFTDKEYTHQDKFNKSDILHGIDVSKHNGTIDWAKVKNAGVDFVIMRAGYRGYLDDGKICPDNLFETYIQQAIKYNFPIGVYFYSQALNETEAKAEAEFTLAQIKKYQQYITLPVVFDYEFAEVSHGRLDKAWADKKLNKTLMTNAAMAFCATVEQAGYKAMVYANKSFLSDNLERTRIENKYSVWLAHYTTKTTYAGDYSIWQYSSTGTVAGISGYVDCNFMYGNNAFQTSELSDVAYTGEAVKPVFTVYYHDKLLSEGTDYIVAMQDNVEIGNATIIITGLGEYAAVPITTVHFQIVPPAVENVQFVSRSEKSVTLQWAAHPLAEGYQVWVERGTDNWLAVGMTTALSYTVSSLSPAANYRFRVCAYKVVNGTHYYGAFSQPLQAATNPAQVTGLKLASATNNTIKLQWTKQKNASKYAVYYYDAAQAQYVLVQEVSGGSKNTCTVKGLAANTKYKFKVKAVKEAKEKVVLEGAFSSVLSAYTAPSAPTIKSAKSSKKKKITVKWKKKTDVSGYQIMWSTSKNFSSNYKSVNVSKKSTSKTLTTAQSKKKYYVRIRAYKTRSGKKYYSPWSKTLSVKTK